MRILKINYKLNPKVSIIIPNYNHVAFLQQRLDSVFNQTVQDFEVILLDDASTDGAVEICLKYAKQNPSKIRFLEHKRKNNIAINDKPSGRFNMLYNLYSANGKYIALCEGDDYWIDPLKLQKQVDFLEANEDYALVFTNGQVVYTNTHEPSHLIYNNTSHYTTSYRVFNLPEETTDIYKLASGNYIHTAGVVFRNWIVEQEVPEYMYRVTIGDWPLHMMTATKGLIKYLDEDMFCYRVHDVGVYSKKTALQKKQMTLGQFPPILNSNYFENSVREVIETYCLKSSKSYLCTCKTGNDFQFFTDFSQSLCPKNEALNNKLLQLLDKRNQNQNKVLMQPVYLRLLKRIKQYIKNTLKL